MPGRWPAARQLAYWGWAGALFGSFLMHPLDVVWCIAAALGSVSYAYLLRRLCDLPGWSLVAEQGERWITDRNSAGTRLTQGGLNLLIWLGSLYALVRNQLPFGLGE